MQPLHEPEVAVSTAINEQITDLAARYGAAWDARDPDTIVAMHTEDSVFCVRGLGDPAVGVEAVRAAFVDFFATWADARFEPRALAVGEQHWVLEWTLHATFDGSLQTPLGMLTAQARPVSFEGVDVIAVRDGLVGRKDTYIDALNLQRQLGAGS